MKKSNTVTLSDIFNPHINSFGLLRFVLASLVIFSHSFAFVSPEFEPLASISKGTITFGTFAVSGFFVLSGFLITRSYVRSDSLWTYSINRFLRIYPAYIVCLILSAFVFALIVSFLRNGNASEWLAAHTYTPAGYIYNNLSIRLFQDVVGDSNPPLISNNSLWTLFYEVLCYCGIGVLGFVGILKRYKVIVPIIWLLLIILLCIGHFFPDAPEILFSSWKMTLYRLSSSFFAGASIFLFAEKLPFRKITAMFLFLLYLLSIPFAITEITDSLLLAYPIIVLGFSSRFSWVDKYGDFSYGIYIYGFPLQIIIAETLVKNFGVTAFFPISLLFALMFAIPSYKWVEKPTLSLKRKA